MSLTREEFQSTLESIFRGLIYQNSNFEYSEAFLTNSKTLVDSLATRYLRGQERIAYYLDLWDNAPDQPSKDAVVGSVTGDLGSAVVNPEDAYLWPSNGRFGDVKGPIQLGSFNESHFAAVDGTSIGNVSIFTAESGKKFVPTCVDFILDQVSGLSLVATVSIGTNSTSYDNLQSATLLTGLNSSGNRANFQMEGLKPVISGDVEVFCRVSVASTATTYDLIASVSGYYI